MLDSTSTTPSVIDVMENRDHIRASKTSLLKKATSELKSLQHITSLCENNKTPSSVERFPPACRKILRSLPGNDRCIDCGIDYPTWASVSHGILMCIECGGRHRSFGVRVSSVRSIDMDSWSYNEVLAMLEGGNQKIEHYFRNDALSCMQEVQTDSEGEEGDVIVTKYRSKAARVYRKNLSAHVMSLRKSNTCEDEDSSTSTKGKSVNLKEDLVMGGRRRKYGRHNDINNKAARFSRLYPVVAYPEFERNLY